MVWYFIATIQIDIQMEIFQKYSGIVIKGMQLGRKLGFPTANMLVEKQLDMPYGVYAIRVTVDNVVYGGISNYGVKPTFENDEILIETHIFDFSDNIYNKKLEIEFVEYIRSEQKFNSIDELRIQIDKDVEVAKSILISVL